MLAGAAILAIWVAGFPLTRLLGLRGALAAAGSWLIQTASISGVRHALSDRMGGVAAEPEDCRVRDS